MDTFEALYRQHASAVFRFAWGLCGNRDDAQEIVAETFFRALTRGPQVEARTALAYLLAIARNTFVSGLRRRRRDAPLGEELEAPQPDLAGRLDDRARLQVLAGALRTLPEGERAALLLRVDHELSYEEVAGVLGISVGAAKVRVHRARLRLASAVAGRGGGDESRSDA